MERIYKPSPLVRLIFLAIVIKILSAAVVFLTFHVAPFQEGSYDQNFSYPAHEEITWKLAYKTWDGNHYLYLADHGYSAGHEANRMFPLFPAVIAAAMRILAMPGMIAGLLLSNVFSLFAFIYLYKLVEQLYSSEIAFRTVLYALVFPTGFFFTRIYSESLFFLLGVLFFFFLYKKNLKWAALFSFLLPLTRPVGVLILAPFAVYLFTGFIKQKTSSKIFHPRLLFLLAPALGLGTSMIIMHVLTGNWYEHFATQQHVVSEHSIAYFINLKRWFLDNFVHLDWKAHGMLNSVFDRLAFLWYVGILFYVFRQQDKTLFCYTFFLGMVPAFSDRFISYTRFLIVIFPLYVQLARSPLNHGRFLLGMFVAQLLLLAGHSLNIWIA